VAPALTGSRKGSLDLRALREVREPLVVVGQIRDREGKRERVGILDIAPAGRGARVVQDVWLDDAKALAEELRAPLGTWDVMHSTRWKYAWHEGRVWDRRGLRAIVIEPGVIEVRRPFLSMGARFARIHAVSRVHARLEEGWLVRIVSVIDGHGTDLVVARKRELSVIIDPVYDGIDLSFDGNWCPQMARALAGALGVPCQIDEDLR
jgi:hypothetical protein